MTSPVILNKIKTIFHYLFDDYGFAVIAETYFESFGNWAVVLQSGDCCRIRIFQDRGEIFIALGPLWSPPSWNAGPWFDLTVIVAFLTQGKDILEYELGKPDWQLERLADRLRPYMEQICELFRENVFEQKREALELLQEQMNEQIWARLIGEK